MILGIDPGLKGSLALLDDDAKLRALIDMPTLRVTKTKRAIALHQLAGWISGAVLVGGPLEVWIEQQQPRPAQGAASGFRNGVGYGQLLGLLAALEVPFTPVSPKRWQNAILGKIDPGTAKDRARELVSRKFPDADLGKRKTQDRADAVCIALYGVQQRRAGEVR